MGKGGGKSSARGGGGGSTESKNFTVNGSKISVDGDTINMTKRGAYQDTLSIETSLSADGKTSTTTETRLYKSNSGAMYEVTEKVTTRERSVAEQSRMDAVNPIRSAGPVMTYTNATNRFDTKIEITKVKKRR